MRLLQITWFWKKEKKKIRGSKTIHKFTKRTEDKANDNINKNTNNGNNNDLSINNDNNNDRLIKIIIIMKIIIIKEKQKTLNRRTQSKRGDKKNSHCSVINSL